jgi:uncharacterized alkaline shock family protein YloU
VEGRASISSDVLARYAADAAREVEGVRAVAEGHLSRRAVRIVEGEDGPPTVELHLVVAWGAALPEVGRAVQRRVGDYLERMAGARPAAVRVVVDEVAPPA